MYQLSVPLMCRNLDRVNKTALTATLKEAGATRVFLAISHYLTDPAKRAEQLASLKENCAYFKAQGFEVGTWLWTFMVGPDAPFTRMESPTGKRSENMACPADPAFRAFAAGYLRDLAATGIDLILFDDDYRFGFHDMGLGCCCKHHRAKMEELLGAPIDPAELPAKLLNGGKDPLRDAWQKAKRESMLLFAREMRHAVDQVNPSVRLGLCACMTLWDLDGVDAATISRTLAGHTKPLLRTIGAPYWAVKRSWGNRLQDVIELTRMERSWCGSGIEIIGEGDCFPRPRTTCPAAFLEGFDTALRADGTLDGILKYMADYTASEQYEPGYFDRHRRNQPLYAEIEKNFTGAAVGVRVYESLNKYAETEIPAEIAGTDRIQNQFFSPAARMLAACSVPTVYTGQGLCGIVFGENARHLPADALEKGLILDLRAAELLKEQGIDVGLTAVGAAFAPEEEYYPAYGEYVGIHKGTAQRIVPHENAEVLSRYGEDPASYFYENAAGQRFFVLAFNGHFNDEFLYRQYTRSRQLADIIPRLGGQKLPAHTWGNPDLYLLCKENAVGLWNFHADTAYEVKVALPYAKKVSFIQCSGTFEKGTATIDVINPYSFAGLRVE